MFNLIDLVVCGCGMLFVMIVLFVSVDSCDNLLLLIMIGLFCVDDNGYLIIISGFVLMGWFVLNDGFIFVFVCDMIDGLEFV